MIAISVLHGMKKLNIMWLNWHKEVCKKEGRGGREEGKRPPGHHQYLPIADHLSLWHPPASNNCLRSTIAYQVTSFLLKLLIFCQESLECCQPPVLCWARRGGDFTSDGVCQSYYKAVDKILWLKFRMSKSQVEWDHQVRAMYTLEGFNKECITKFSILDASDASA